MKPRTVLAILTVVVILSQCSAISEARDQEKSSRPPNVLLILCDQLNPRVMGWTGQSQVKTPNLDYLASTGVSFTNAYCASPVCAPTRHSIYTGMFPADHGVLMNDHPIREGTRTLMDYLNKAGWTTANIGKMHNAPYHCRRDFQYVLHHEFYDCDAGISHYASYLAREVGLRGLTPGTWVKPRPGVSWIEDVNGVAFTGWMPEDITAERWITDQSLKFIQDQKARRPDQPFFLHASYFPPHHPYGPIAKYARMYDPANIKLPPNFDRAALDRWCTGKGTPDHMTDEDVKRWIAYYYGFVTQLDNEVGRLLNGLVRLGIANETVVIFAADHGDMLAEHGMFYKGVMYEASARVPFIVRWPGTRRGVREASPISHVDIMPTVLNLAGLKVDAELAGEDLWPAMMGQGRSDRAVYSEFYGEGEAYGQLPFKSLMYRQAAYKLIASHSRLSKEQVRYELYNVEEDPWEMRNLAETPEMASAFQTLKDALMAIWHKQQTKLPAKMPPAMARSTYKIPWPADPWKAVEPVTTAPASAPNKQASTAATKPSGVGK